MTKEVASDLEKHVVDSINAEREAAGLEALKIEVHLNAAADDHSDWMSDTGEFSHTGEDGSSANERVADAGLPLEGTWRTTENIALRSIDGDLDEGEVDQMHADLMESEGHRANILDPDVSYVGVGLSVGTQTIGGVSQDVAYLTEDFADTAGRVSVQEDVGGKTMLQDYVDGKPVGAQYAPDDDTDDDDDDGSGANDDEDEEEDEDAKAASSGGCFVATAAYGSWTHPDVVALRHFRDTVLVRSASGRAFIAAYRSLGPKLARFVVPGGASGRAARALIAPLARLAARRTERGGR